MEFQGYRRPDGKVGVRNHVLVIPSVVCSQGAAEMISRNIKGAIYLPNVFGCAQVGEDRAQTKRALVGFGLNPNIYSVLVVGNGCETIPAKEIAEALAPGRKRVEYIEIQEVGGTKKTAARGRKIVKEMLADAAKVPREPIPVSELIFATECGGSDFTSGLGSNPALGACSDLVIEDGGTVILSETTELIGAEHLLAKRARTPEIGQTGPGPHRLVGESSHRHRTGYPRGEPRPGKYRRGHHHHRGKVAGLHLQGGNENTGGSRSSTLTRPRRKGWSSWTPPATTSTSSPG